MVSSFPYTHFREAELHNAALPPRRFGLLRRLGGSVQGGKINEVRW
jgi:hypothetical protein